MRVEARIFLRTHRPALSSREYDEQKIGGLRSEIYETRRAVTVTKIIPETERNTVGSRGCDRFEHRANIDRVVRRLTFFFFFFFFLFNPPFAHDV